MRRIPLPKSHVASGSARVAVAAGTDTLLSEEKDALLRVRLRAATLLLAVALALLQFRDVLFVVATPWQLQVAAILALAFCFSLLSFPGPPSGRWLKVAEIAIFGIVATALAVRQYHIMISWAARGDEASFVVTSKNTIIGSIILMFVYAMLIPNDWRRAGLGVMAIAACPIICEVALFLVHPEVFHLVRRVAVLRRTVESAIQMAIVAVLATYGAHLLNTLRVRAIEARQLNQYRLREQIGAGGMGEVHLAEHRLLKRPCAIKLIRSERAGNPRSLEQFEHEVQAMARLTHPNTVEVFDYGHTEDGTFYYVMEYLPGLSLEGLVAGRRPAHAQPRDLSPASSLRCPGGGSFRGFDPPRPQAGEHLRHAARWSV